MNGLVAISFRSGVDFVGTAVNGLVAFGTLGAVRVHADGRVTPDNDNLYTSGTWTRVTDAQEN